LAIFEATRCVIAARADALRSNGTVETFASYHLGRETVTEESITLGSANEDQISISFTADNHIESIATVNAIKLILAAASDLRSLRDEHQERLSLWPMGDFVPSQEGTIINGCISELMATARRVACAHVSVLITGESGTGKEILARAIHHYSPRSTRPFIPFNCTAVPRDMLESQMFGHRRGAFTGADRDYPGLIRAAKEGTLFLDEVGELGLDLQPKLLRFLESGEISPLGEPGPLTVNVRIVAATNRNLEELVQEGRFREDLFYRLNVVRLTIPPLRERRDEIPALVHHFTMRAAAEFNKGRIRVAEETMEHLLLHHWPGNVRELNNEIRRMVALADTDDVLEPPALSPAVRKAAKTAKSATGDLSVSLQDKLGPTIARIEREMIQAALRVHHGRVEAAAQALGISRKGLYLKRQRLGL